MLDGKFVFSMPSAYPRIDLHCIDFSLVLADVGMAMEKAHKANRPCVLARVLKIHDMLTVAMTQQALLLDETSECSCASATSCCVCGHADDEASLSTCATCMVNYHKECVETSVQNVVGQGKVSNTHCHCSLLPSSVFAEVLCEIVLGIARVRHFWRVTALEFVLPRMQLRISVSEMPQEKRIKTVENQTCFNIFLTSLIPIQRLKLSDQEEPNFPDARGGERMAAMLMR